MINNDQFDDEELDDINDGSDDENAEGEGEEEPEQKKSLGERAQEIKDKYDEAKDLKEKLDKLRSKSGKAKPTPKTTPAESIPKPTPTGGVGAGAGEGVVAGGGAVATGGGAAAAGGTAAAGGVAAVAVPVAIVLAIILVIVLLVWVFVGIFMGGKNKINSMAGGSFFMAPDHNKAEDLQIVSNLQAKRDGNNPDHKLVINGDGSQDIDWQWNDQTNRYTHKLDIRLLKTLDYLTDRHKYVEIGMLRTNAPTLLRHSLRVKPQSVDDTEETSKSKVQETETFSAFYTGQAMAITAVDYSKIQGLAGQPIEVGWQRTLIEKAVRPLWEELAFSVGYLDDKSVIYAETAKLEVGDPEVERLAQRYLETAKSDEFNVYKEGFRKIDRIIQLLDRINTLEFISSAGSLVGLSKKMDERTVDYLDKANGFFSDLKDKIGANPDLSLESAVSAIRAMGDSVNLLNQGASATYKATQVANMVGWNERGIINLKWNKAYEARNKIRQVTKELLEMPRATAEAYAALWENFVGPPTAEEYEKMKFTKDLVAKQIIVFSPEDDLDNGLMRLDVYPKGITAVSVGGVAIEGTKVETEKDAAGNIISAATIGDGIVDAADTHFSYKPIDNGVFSKHGTNYIFVNMPDNVAEVVVQFLKATVGLGAARALFDYWAGICKYNPLNESCQPVTYKGFLQVAF